MEFPIYVENGWRGPKAAWIKASDKVTDAYHVQYRDTSDMVVRRGGPQGPIVGTVDFRMFKSTELHFADHQKSFTLGRAGIMFSTQAVELPAAPKDKNFEWTRTFTGTIKLKDASGQELARFDRSRGLNKTGTLTFLVSELEQQFLDQIIVSFVAMVEKIRRARRGAAAAAGGAAGSA